MGKYLQKKIFIYLLTFFVAVTINWMLPRLMPGDPIMTLLSRFQVHAESVDVMRNYINELYGFDKPFFIQYIDFWKNFLRGNLGISIFHSPRTVVGIIMESLPYTLLVMLPAILLSWIIGNKFGAYAARRKKMDNYALPAMYTLTAIPPMWLGIVLAFVFGVSLRIFPLAFAYSPSIRIGFSFAFIIDFIAHWILPFLSLFIVALGGWAIGMRNMIIYELEANYSRYLQSLGATDTLIRKYAYRNAILPQITGLGIQLGLVVAGSVTTEIVFSYPGIGSRLLDAINNKDFLLMQGCFIFIIIGVLLANFIVDIVYVLIDPRIRFSYTGSK